MIALYILFALSLFLPIYAYAIYPLLLRCRKEIKYKKGACNCLVTVAIIGKKEEAISKIENIKRSSYSNLEIIVADDYSDCIARASGDYFIFTDLNTELDSEAISEIVKPFYDERVGCVVGQQTNPSGNSAYWKYENRVRLEESRIGCVSGATASLFAVRKRDIPVISDKILNAPFFVSMSITQQGKAVVFQPTAKTYETCEKGTNFWKHVEDSKGYWQAFRLFPKMLLFQHGSFVYVSHRVLKMFVWLNMIILLLSSLLLGSISESKVMLVMFFLQLVGYVFLLTLGRRKTESVLGKIFNIAHYFLMLNISYFVGFFGTVR